MSKSLEELLEFQSVILEGITTDVLDNWQEKQNLKVFYSVPLVSQ